MRALLRERPAAARRGSLDPPRQWDSTSWALGRSQTHRPRQLSSWGPCPGCPLLTGRLRTTPKDSPASCQTTAPALWQHHAAFRQRPPRAPAAETLRSAPAPPLTRRSRIALRAGQRPFPTPPTMSARSTPFRRCSCPTAPTRDAGPGSGGPAAAVARTRCARPCALCPSSPRCSRTLRHAQPDPSSETRSCRWPPRQTPGSTRHLRG
mmetsp:Transcript_35336/g.83835  ORF Transcript_35336/g.83835 Transcript_35336/m.83835 type:complete len:208 (-) Transcript_35336:731-1354(-)